MVWILFLKTTDMNSISTYETDLQHDTLMSFFANRPNAERQRGRLWKAESIAYLLAILAHVAVWQIYQAMPPTPPQIEEPPLIMASLVMAPPAPVASAPTPPTPVVQPPKAKPLPKPKPKPLPKPEKPVVKKPDRPKPQPKPEPQTVAEPTPAPPVESAPPAPVEAPKASPKAEDELTENTQYHAGGISGFGRRYSRLAEERGWEGTVKLKVQILASGDIGAVIVISSSGHEELDEQAVELVKEAHATPAHRGDKPVDSWVIVPYQFRIQRH
jgi:protein TonB